MLLGYFLDGKHRLALVCDPNGKILARSVLRLLIDEKNQPVLLQEKIYIADDSAVYKELIRKISKKKAQYLGIPLVVSMKDFSDEVGLNYTEHVFAGDKPVPFEYVDALGGLQSSFYWLEKQNLIQVL